MSGQQVRPSEESLIALYEQLQTEMRWRRDGEFRIYREAIAISTGALTAAIALREFALQVGHIPYCVLGAIVVVVTLLTVKRVLYENQVYRDLGKMSVSVFKRLELLTFTDAGHVRHNSVLDSNATRFGQGSGYTMTIKLMIFLGVAICSVIYFIGKSSPA